MTEKMIRIVIEGNATTSFSPDVIKSVVSPFLIVSSVDLPALESEVKNEPV